MIKLTREMRQFINRSRSNETPCITPTASPDEWSVGSPKSKTYSDLSRLKYPSPSPICAPRLFLPENGQNRIIFAPQGAPVQPLISLDLL